MKPSRVYCVGLLLLIGCTGNGSGLEAAKGHDGAADQQSGRADARLGAADSAESGADSSPSLGGSGGRSDGVAGNVADSNPGSGGNAGSGGNSADSNSNLGGSGGHSDGAAGNVTDSSPGNGGSGGRSDGNIGPDDVPIAGDGRLVDPDLGAYVGDVAIAPDSGGGTGGIGGGTGGASGGSGGGGGMDAFRDVPPDGDTTCGQTASTSRQLADMLMVLDRSGSMNYSTADDSNCATGATNCISRWQALTSAIDATLGNTSGSIMWGLKLFASPNGGLCGVSSGVEVPIAASSVTTIRNLIDNTLPGNNTPTAQAIAAATAYLTTVTDANAKYILLATDGEPNCGTGGTSVSDVQATLAAITAAKSAGFPVYVIGIGPSVGNLDNFAVAGGTGAYYPASSSQDLDNDFTAISSAVASCAFVLAQTPPNANNMAVYLDGNLVAQDPIHGWSHGANAGTIVLNGSSCAAVTSGAATTVRVVFVCPGSSPPPTLPY